MQASLGRQKWGHGPKLWRKLNSSKNHALYVHLTYKDVHRFRNASAQIMLLESLRNEQSSCLTCSHELYNKLSHVRVRTTKHWQKTKTTDLNTNYHAETRTSADVKKKTNARKQIFKFEDEANSMQLDKGGKVK